MAIHRALGTFIKTSMAEYRIKLYAKFFDAGKSTPTTTTDFGKGSKLEDTIILPRVSHGILQLHIQLGYKPTDVPLIPMMWYGPVWSNFRVVDTGSGLDIQLFGSWQGTESDIPFPIKGFNPNELSKYPCFTVNFSTNYTSEIKVQYTFFNRGMLLEVDRISWIATLRVEREVAGEVEIGPVKVTSEVSYIIWGFALNKITLDPRHHPGETLGTLLYKEFWSKLNEKTRQAIQNGQRPGGKPVVIEGHTSKIGSEAHNLNLGHNRAEEVRRGLEIISGAHGGSVFITPTHGAYLAKGTHEDDPRDRKVVIKLTQIH